MTFYRTIIEFEVLSEAPIGDRNLAWVLEECASGEYSGMELQRTETTV